MVSQTAKQPNSSGLRLSYVASVPFCLLDLSSAHNMPTLCPLYLFSSTVPELMEDGDGMWFNAQFCFRLVYEAHPKDSEDLVHGEAAVFGDMKIIKLGQVHPSGENGNFLPPGQQSQNITSHGLGFQNGAKCHDLRCVLHPSTPRCWV